MNFEQLKGIFERWLTSAITALLTAAILKGYVPFLSQDDVPTLVPALVTVAVGAVLFALGWAQNRAKSLAQAVTSARPGTVVVTDPKIAAATPDNPNIIANTLPATQIKEVVADAREVARRD